MPNTGQTVGEVNTSHTCAVSKCFTFNTYNTVRKCDISQCCQEKCTATNGGYIRWNVGIGQISAPAKRTLANIGHIIRNGNAG